MTYNLGDGYSVVTRNIPQGKEFQTLNAAGDTISTVRLPHGEANALVRDIARLTRRVR